MADGEDVRDLVPESPQIRLVQLEGGDPLSIGEKRNFGCERAAGSVICFFDDDDHSEPYRIQNQITRLVNSGKSVTGYRSMVFTGPSESDKWLYLGDSHYALGTSLCFTKEYWQGNPFPALQIGEDNHFVATAAAKGQLITADACGLLTATIHDSNTSPRMLSGSSWKKLC